MFPLAGKNFPTSAEELASAMEAALAEVFALPAGAGGVVSISGGETYPALRAVTIRLDGATVGAAKPPPKPLPAAGTREPGVTVERLDVSARPVRYEQAKLNLKLSGSGLTFDFGRDGTGRPLLLLTDADRGTVEAEIGKADVQALLQAVASAVAAEQGITIQDLHVDLSSDGPRSVAANVRVKAKKMFMSGVIVVTGRVDVDDELTATISHLACTGEGVIGGTAAGIVRNKLRPFDGTKVPLMAFSLGDVKLRDLKIAIGDSVHVSAAFGNKA